MLSQNKFGNEERREYSVGFISAQRRDRTSQDERQEQREEDDRRRRKEKEASVPIVSAALACGCCSFSLSLRSPLSLPPGATFLGPWSSPGTQEPEPDKEPEP